METEQKFWKTHIQFFAERDLGKLVELLNAFGQVHWVIATQVFAPEQTGDQHWVALVYYKVKPTSR